VERSSICAVDVDYTLARLLLEPSEGNVSHMYLDTKGLVTVGIGNMLPSAAAAQALPFIDRDTRNRATAAQIATDFASVESQPDSKASKYYRQFTKLDLPSVDVDSLFRARVDEFVGQLKAAYPQFDSYPAGAKLALLDLVFNMGIGKLKSHTEWPKLNAAIAKQDWITAASECNRPDANARRNAETKAYFIAASGESK
jgi:GH24 family phage-related lysozyme (muramidase)